MSECGIGSAADGIHTSFIYDTVVRACFKTWVFPTYQRCIANNLLSERRKADNPAATEVELYVVSHASAASDLISVLRFQVLVEGRAICRSSTRARALEPMCASSSWTASALLMTPRSISTRSTRTWWLVGGGCRMWHFLSIGIKVIRRQRLSLEHLFVVLRLMNQNQWFCCGLQSSRVVQVDEWEFIVFNCNSGYSHRMGPCLAELPELI